MSSLSSSPFVKWYFQKGLFTSSSANSDVSITSPPTLSVHQDMAKVNLEWRWRLRRTWMNDNLGTWATLNIWQRSPSDHHATPKLCWYHLPSMSSHLLDNERIKLPSQNCLTMLPLGERKAKGNQRHLTFGVSTCSIFRCGDGPWLGP